MPGRPPGEPGGAVRSTVVRRRVGLRRVKRTIRHIDPGSVLKFSLFFYTIFLFLWLGVVWLAYTFVEGAGWIDLLEENYAGFALGDDPLRVSLFTVERWAFLIGLTFVVLGSILNVFLAFLYNLAADMFGGLQMTFSERD